MKEETMCQIKKIEDSTIGFACTCFGKCYEATEEKETSFFMISGILEILVLRIHIPWD